MMSKVFAEKEMNQGSQGLGGPLPVKREEEMHNKVWYMSENCYNTIPVKWILKQPRGADVFIFYQKLFVKTVQLGTESLPYNEINPKNEPSVDMAIQLLLKVGFIEEETKDGVVWIRVPDNDVLRRKI